MKGGGGHEPAALRGSNHQQITKYELDVSLSLFRTNSGFGSSKVNDNR